MEPPHGNGYAMKANGIGKCPNICDVNKDASPPGPDGRLSWAIAITCFLINFIAAFFYRCPGMFFNSVMDTFDATRGDASVPVSLYGAFYNMAGLVAGALIGSLGVRPTLILGGVMMAVGFGVSLFATSTLFLVFTVGALAGVGHGMVFSCSIVAVTGYFDKRRGIALGLNMAGPPITSLLVPKLLEWLLGEYGLRGTFLILGGCMANVPVLGIMLRNPPWEDSIGKAAVVQAEDCFAEAFTAMDSARTTAFSNSWQGCCWPRPCSTQDSGSVVPLPPGQGERKKLLNTARRPPSPNPSCMR
ncbi:monocarboxylate transporter 4 [Rhipicephalus sanguineus]|uniref:monocarboxylate transporter 4 n=1 Tax=Rhipicephalus sanguineus TaxID=34632 RepID=UPI00189489A2|nr:monocarboxylate transporter 4 [Rhipicephalus sanguineus]